MEWDPLTRMTSSEKRQINTIAMMSEIKDKQIRVFDFSLSLLAEENAPVKTKSTMMAANPTREIVGLSGTQEGVGGMFLDTRVVGHLW